MSLEGTAGSRMMWLATGAFTQSPAEPRFPLTLDTLAEEIARSAAGLRVSIADQLGAGEMCAFVLNS